MLFSSLLKKAIKYGWVLFFLIATKSFSQVSSMNLWYKPAANVNGLTPVQVTFKYKFINAFGSMHISYDADCKGDLEYQYKGKSYMFSGMDEGVKAVRTVDPTIEFTISGPDGFTKTYTPLIISGMGGGVLSPNDIEFLPSIKSEAQGKPENYRIVSARVISVGSENTSMVQEQIEKKIREDERMNKLQALRSSAQTNENLNRLTEALKNYQSILDIDPGNSLAQQKVESIKKKMDEKGKKEKYDDIYKAAAEAERANNLPLAEKLFRDAAEIPIASNYARNDADRVQSKIKKKENDEIAVQKKAIEEANKAQENLLKEKEKKEKEKKEAFDKVDRDAKEARDNRLRELQDKLDREQREKLEAERERERQERREEEKRKEKEEDEKDKKATSEMLALDQKIINQTNGKWNPKEYYVTALKAEEYLRQALNVKPYEALQLKKEWWDYSAYSKVFADELYETQRRENFIAYRAKTAEQLSKYNSAKGLFILALYYVNKGSNEEKYLISRINFCSKVIRLNEIGRKYDVKGEANRIKYREMNRSLEAAKISQYNREKVELAFAALDAKATYPAENLMKKINLSQRMEAAQVQYKKDAAITMVSQSAAINVMVDDNKELDNSAGYGILNLNVGFGMLNNPILLNERSNSYQPQTTMSDLITLPVNAGFDLWFAKTDALELSLGANSKFGVFPQIGTTSLYFDYGYNTNFNFGFKFLKIVTSYEWKKLYGKMGIDYDVFINSNTSGASSSGRIASGKFKYTTSKIGVGLKADWGDIYEPSYIMIKVFGEKPSFYPESLFKKPVLSFLTEYMGPTGIALSIIYGNNYVIAGEKSETIYNPKNKDLFSMNITKYWTIN